VLEEEVTKVVEGWVGKPEGLLQVLGEQGFVYPTITNPNKHYTINGAKNKFGFIDQSLNLKHLMTSCINFKEEVPL